MAVSILYLGEGKSQLRPLSERALYHFSLDRSFSRICNDVKKTKYFLSLVSEMTDSKDEIMYRQEVIRDFENNPELLEQLVSLSSRFEELRVSQKTADKEKYRLNNTGAMSSVASKNILQTQAICLKRALLFIKAYGELLAEFELKSRGLTELYTACREIYENPDFSRLILFCSKYENFSSSGFWNFRFSLNDEGYLEKYELIDHRYIHISDPDLKKKGFSIFKKTEEISHPCERLSPIKDGLFENLSIFALSDISRLFGNISEQIFTKFGLIDKELVFYEIALKYIEALSEKKVPICYPIFTENQGVRVKNLYDIYLLMSKPEPTHVIPHDFAIEQGRRGLLVFGNNGSGKTVYLRSIGTMQILAQAGLPIPCESAQLELFKQIATQFSESEKEFCDGNDAGRFEQEVRELAKLVDTLKEDSIVFLNETFQSTAYAEGSDCLYHLLNHFSALNIRWILVTHLRQLEEMFSEDEISILHIINFKQNQFL